MKKLYEKDEVWFALVWIGLYVVLMNVALQFCGGMDDLAGKNAGQVAVPVVCGLALAASSTGWILRNGLAEKYGLCAFRGSWKAFLYFVPLIAVSCINFIDGVGLNAPLGVSVLMAANMAIAGYVEEIIFRGFLFRGMARGGLRSAVIVSAVTFGAGHIVNLVNTSDILGVLLQVCYAIAAGFMFTMIVYKGGSLIPCIVSHMVINGASVFALEGGPFTRLVGAVTGQTTPEMVQAVSAMVLLVVSGAYAWWLWKKA